MGMICLRNQGSTVQFLNDERPKTPGFRSVVVITCASHAQGRRFEPGRKQNFWCGHKDLPKYGRTTSLKSYLARWSRGMILA